MAAAAASVSQRSTLDHTLTSLVDDALKVLRIASRRLAKTFAAHTTEARILFRLHYKGNNQYRNMTFWRRVVECKRVVERIERLDPKNVIEPLREIFYRTEAANQAVNMKVAQWTQVPPSKRLKAALDDIRQLCLLYSKAIGIYARACISFTQFSHATSFLPYTMALIAAVSRLRFLLFEVDDEIREAWRAVHRLYAGINSRHSPCRCKLPPPLPLDRENDIPQSTEAMRLDQPPSGEDLGNRIQRPQPPRGEVTMTPLLPAPKAENISQATDTSPTVEMEDLIVLDLDAPIIRKIPAAPPAPRKADTPMPTPMITTAKPKKKKPKVKRDVIDVIFE